MLLIAGGIVLKLLHIVLWLSLSMCSYVIFAVAFGVLLYESLKAVPEGKPRFNATTLLLSGVIIMFSGALLRHFIHLLGNVLIVGGITIVAICYGLVFIARLKKG